MKKNLIILGLATLAIVLMAASGYRRSYATTTVSYRPTVLTSAQTTITLPNDHYAQETFIMNRGTGVLYIKWSAGTISTTTDTHLHSGEALPVLHGPWTTVELLATGSSAEAEMIVSY